MKAMGLPAPQEGCWRNIAISLIDRVVSVNRLITGRHPVKPRGSGSVWNIHRVAKPFGLWETGGMKKPELTDAGWLGPRDEMDRASHRFGQVL
jgi:hypothetical protein